MSKLYMRSIILLAIALSIVIAGPSYSDEELRLSLDDCLNLGLSNNLDIKIAKIDSEIKGQDRLISTSIFDTMLTGSASYEDDRRAVATSIIGQKSLTNNYAMGVSKKLPTGTELEIDWSSERVWTDSIFALNNPLHTAELSFSLRQPVLYNFFGYIDRSDIKLTEIEIVNADLGTLDRIEDVIADIEKAYWRLILAYKDFAFRQQIMDKAEELYRANEEHLKVGLVETTALYAAESNMRIRKTEVALAENRLKTASNKLKLLINEGGDFLITPENDLMPPTEGADMVKSLNGAFLVRRDYKAMKNDLRAKNIKLKMKKNSMWPEIDLVGSYTVNGVHRKFPTANKKLSTDKFPKLYGGIEVKMPIENRSAHGQLNTALLEKTRAILKMQQLEKEIINEIDDNVRAVNVYLENAKRRSKIRQIEALKLRDEEKSFKRGRSSTKTMIDYQNDLFLAQINEYFALVEYYSSMIDLENSKDMLLERVGVTG
ncbi:MAG: TolC family protein [Candidatus Omnitrophota bacterium]